MICRAFGRRWAEGFALYSGQLGTAAPFLKYVPPGFSLYTV